MKKLLCGLGLLLLLAGPACAQHAKNTKTDTIISWVERMAAQRDAERLKSYYTDRETATTCEAWNSCAKYAFEQYTQDQSFRIVKAQLKTVRKVHRHRVTREKHLFVEATYAHRTVRLEFTTPNASGRTRPYHYIGQLPK